MKTEHYQDKKTTRNNHNNREHNKAEIQQGINIESHKLKERKKYTE